MNSIEQNEFKKGNRAQRILALEVGQTLVLSVDEQTCTLQTLRVSIVRLQNKHKRSYQVRAIKSGNILITRVGYRKAKNG